jgi:multisubunit Na+/H+ antiporter MnhB subunit
MKHTANYYQNNARRLHKIILFYGAYFFICLFISQLVSPDLHVLNSNTFNPLIGKAL